MRSRYTIYLGAIYSIYSRMGWSLSTNKHKTPENVSDCAALEFPHHVLAKNISRSRGLSISAIEISSLPISVVNAFIQFAFPLFLLSLHNVICPITRRRYIMIPFGISVSSSVPFLPK